MAKTGKGTRSAFHTFRPGEGTDVFPQSFLDQSLRNAREGREREERKGEIKIEKNIDGSRIEFFSHSRGIPTSSIVNLK